MTTGKTIALARRTFVGRVMSLLFNMLSRFVIAFLPRSKHLLVSWPQSPSAVIFDPKARPFCDRQVGELRECVSVSLVLLISIKGHVSTAQEAAV